MLRWVSETNYIPMKREKATNYIPMKREKALSSAVRGVSIRRGDYDACGANDWLEPLLWQQLRFPTWGVFAVVRPIVASPPRKE